LRSEILAGVSFRILAICTGNVCRSPMAELLLRDWADPRAGLQVSSAGTQALVGRTVDGGTAALLRRWGLDPTRHHPRQLSAAMAAEADLILTAERAHRDQLIRDLPSAFKRTFTMVEFARLAERLRTSDSPAAAVAAVAAVAAARAGAGPVPPDDDDLPDPFGWTASRTRPVAERLTGIVQLTLDALNFSPRRIHRLSSGT
jgi:protein-tyrosine phosphatase